MTLAWDTETGRKANGLYAPPLVCLSWRDSHSTRPDLIPSEHAWYHVHQFMRRRLEGGEDFVGFNLAYDWGCLIQCCPDLAPLVFDAYDQGRVVEIEIVERLTQIATGERGLNRQLKYPSLERLVLHYGLPPLVKDDGVRLSYGPLLFQPLTAYSERQRTYALEDADGTWYVGRRSRDAARAAGVTDEAIWSESRHAFWTHLVNAWGLRTSSTRVEDLRRAALGRLNELRAIAGAAGFIRDDGKTNTVYLQQYVAAKVAKREDPARGKWVPGRTVGVLGVPKQIRDQKLTGLGLIAALGEWAAANPTASIRFSEGARTEVKWQWEYVPPALRPKAPRVKPKVPRPPNVATSKVIREDSGDPTLESLAELGAVASVVNLQIPMLEQGIRHPIHTRYRLAGTTRTTSDGDEETEGSGNQQNAARNILDLPHLRVRECYEPRPGHSFGDLDASSLELNTFAQVLGWKCGRWDMASLLNQDGYDPHAEFARRNLLPPGAGPDHPEFKESRQFAKIPNYGKLGGQGAVSLQRYARQQGIKMTLDRAREIDRMWKRDNPDAVYYQQAYIASLERPCPRHGYDRPRGPNDCETCGLHDFEIPGSPGIWRRGVSFTSACNGHFQGLGAQVMKAIGWRLMREAWCDRSSPLWIGYGARMVRFVHDSFFYELPFGSEHDVMSRVAEVAIDGLARGLPNLKAGVSYHATLVDCKAASRVTDERGRLRAWDPERDGKRKAA